MGPALDEATRAANPDRGDQTIADLEARNDGPWDEEVAMLTAYQDKTMTLDRGGRRY